MVGTDLLPALAFAGTAAVATFFSPCAYALLPGYVGFYTSRTEEPTLGGALARGLAAAAGVVVTLALVLGAAFQVGNRVFANLRWLEIGVGVVLILVGVLVVAGLDRSLSIPLPKRRSSVLGFGVFGAGYAVASAGCVAPIVVTVVVQALSYPPGEAALLLATYVGGVAALVLSLTVVTGMGLLAGASRFAAYSRRLEQLAGVVMILAGIGQLYVALTLSSTF
ncbi:cytochrome c biogenesis protein CcdA [Halopiger goleimassiliensis]|uniref:cytochrome c biogenesis protein CcdA n=1 Tax=Halopiger goleimassiliensis TaxID=1293048 RepID=UPI000677C99A|nr:cytochrome c biogenesis protein CcdA [Halopiger goleimassiliensis]